MATLMGAPPLLPPHVAGWTAPMPFMDNKDKRPALRLLQQSSPAARTKKERPCDGCRRRKSKCVLQDAGRCVLCEFHKQDCTFIEKAQPRKRKLDDAISSSESTVRRADLPAQDASRLPSAPQSRPRSPVALAEDAISAPVRKPLAVDESLSLQRHRHCKLVGQTTALDASLLSLGAFDNKNESESQHGRLRQVGANEYFSLHNDADVLIPDDEARALAEIETIVGQYSTTLIDIYFRNVHPSYPIIQKQAFLDRQRHGDRQFNPPLLAAMYILALSWWEQEPDLAAAPKPDVNRLEYIAITSLTVAMQRPKMSAVQAGLLLLQRAKSSTWTLTVQLVALSQDIGLHLDCTDWSIPLWERRLRKRLAWALYMQDKWSALLHGRPSHINAADWAVPALTAPDFDETMMTADGPVNTSEGGESDVHMLKGRSIFTQMIALTAILSDVLTTFYSQTALASDNRAGAAYSTQLVLNRAKPVQIRLKQWFASLPPACKMDNDNTAPGILTPTGYLHLAYFATEISIHRRIIQTTASGTPGSANDKYMLYIIRSAAKTRLISAMDFVNRLRPEHLHAFWFFASAGNFALIGTFGALLQATSPGKEETEFYGARLHEFAWTLSCCAKRAPWVGQAVDMLEANGELLASLAEKPEAKSMEVSRPRGQDVRSAPAFVFDDDDDDEEGEEGQEEVDGEGDVDYGVGEVMEIDEGHWQYA
ncbi:hypothetical protein LTR62_004278 [Meristemomyces frigidus]|uniref:Zn(2)-C6 fungal-type domain-containing protein n=1 Tax=Meristemomyces frigidus TaxID=1508187 RepID=A0AAN7TFZ4_9PEZI|nr:hypothetical protein LTR62_004278 [Meristemomyces frigidus]